MLTAAEALYGHRPGWHPTAGSDAATDCFSEFRIHHLGLHSWSLSLWQTQVSQRNPFICPWKDIHIQMQHQLQILQVFVVAVTWNLL